MRKKRTKRARQKRLLRRLVILQAISLLILVTIGLYAISRPARVVEPVTQSSNVEIVEDFCTELPETVDTNQSNAEETVEIPKISDSNEHVEIDLSSMNIVKSIGDVNPECLELVQRNLFLLPDGMLEYFLSDGWEIYVTDENIGAVYLKGTYNSVLEATVYSKKWIIIDNRIEAPSASLHAFGHYMDYVNGTPVYTEADLPSLSDEFKEIASEEMETFKANIPNSSCVRNTQEFYAELFYYYLTKPSKCTPKGFEYIKSQIDIFQKRCSL